MLTEDYIAALRHEGHLLIEAVASAELGGVLDAVVVTCPEWSVRDLAHHMGQVHRWAATFVREARPTMTSAEEDERNWGPMPADSDLLGWLRAGHAELVAALDAAPADLRCWSFLPAPSPLAFWARRQAHETAIHRVDAQLAVGAPGPDPVALSFAVDGIDELLLGFYSSPRNRLRLPEPRRLAIEAADAGITWTVQIGPEGATAERGRAQADAQLSGPAGDLYYALWNRRPLSGLDLDGDQKVIDSWRTTARIQRR